MMSPAYYFFKSDSVTFNGAATLTAFLPLTASKEADSTQSSLSGEREAVHLCDYSCSETE